MTRRGYTLDGHHWLLLALLLAGLVPLTIRAGTNVWTSNGPDAGLVLALAINPQSPATLYAGIWGVGVFESTNGGASWSAINTGLPANTIVYALAIDPQSPATLYAGTIDGGVYMSTNGGASWSAANTGLANIYMLALAIDPQSPATLYAGTDGGGVFESTDGGASWSAINNGLTDSYVQALAIDPQSPATLYAGTRGGGVYGITFFTCPAIRLSPASLPGGTVGAAYNQAITASGGTAPYTFALTSGVLPAGLTLSPGGALTGAPTAAGSSAYTVTATDANGCQGSTSYTLDVVCPVITVTSSPSLVPSGAVGDVYGPVTFSATGSNGAYHFSTSGSLPPGLTLVDNGNGTATLSGTPTAAGAFSFSVIATDSNGCSGSLSVNLFISLYNTSILDDLEKSEMCANSHTGAWSYTILKGPDAGATFTGTGILESGNGYFRINSPPGSSANVKLTYYYLHGASATFSDGAAGVSSALNDHYTQDDPPTCTAPPAL